MKSVLISIQPKWCELIASGKKTVEVRKTKPKLETPFKCYIYQTKGKEPLLEVLKKGDNLGYGETYKEDKPYFIKGLSEDYFSPRRQKVIGEFVCDRIYDMRYSDRDGYGSADGERFMQETCLKVADMLKYGVGHTLYGWHISDLKIYDQPKESEAFEKPCNHSGDCCTCKHWHDSFMEEPAYCDLENEPITRPPQSWCYVEETKCPK